GASGKRRMISPGGAPCRGGFRTGASMLGSAMFAGLALIAAAFEAAVGYPDVLFRVIGHPVTWMGRLIAWADRTWNSEDDSPAEQRTQGIVFMVVLVAVSLLLGFIL